ncbi:hypothetical protein A3H85_03125 [Candidatus Daviesbacteria bacterium RIFCSPLOWO2_02_FULL_40_8]|uniref:Uncharacterized protein n=1 Tax=Candidatus Daviesbacteria bacterium RIFCSPLOWO2_01_FULL_40_24 TaxID=1797787 RepID=A0A1F5MJ18_9BACT|nr:MAG: hypothetical protein A2780_00320 [Candidatus Daviesbacteria bacterium RIFCSPHIGHO2_01_FULL_41_45]OGE34464.1 MAG: hypothetical protein A3C32_03920 [Candidatus Daviesbacteria bacterium RIFCSPHIGHO2_02_FULL_41_14]OGE65376.1 MAG: hypothetical protein A3B49_00615 [Candidatus Daviesbacteria bacterium RIFCSPLOWO2_01_FULL_40_24]OGE66764.1 MAG: hypothetical protein A3H85_03125 [Candidatus Daviesbacteria bacterium RIFCSPLOWO2_02_FULL_40_8]
MADWIERARLYSQGRITPPVPTELCKEEKECVSILNSLGFPKSLEEIRDQVWKGGDIVFTNTHRHGTGNSMLTNTGFELSAVYPHANAHRGAEGSGERTGYTKGSKNDPGVEGREKTTSLQIMIEWSQTEGVIGPITLVDYDQRRDIIGKNAYDERLLRTEPMQVRTEWLTIFLKQARSTTVYQIEKFFAISCASRIHTGYTVPSLEVTGLYDINRLVGKREPYSPLIDLSNLIRARAQARRDCIKNCPLRAMQIKQRMEAINASNITSLVRLHHEMVGCNGPITRKGVPACAL